MTAFQLILPVFFTTVTSLDSQQMEKDVTSLTVLVPCSSLQRQLTIFFQ